MLPQASLGTAAGNTTASMKTAKKEADQMEVQEQWCLAMRIQTQ